VLFVTAAQANHAIWVIAIAAIVSRQPAAHFFAAVVVKASDFSILSGEPSWFEKPADRGHIMRRAFCSDCGSPLFIVNESNTNARALYAGSLDDPSWYEPSRNIYVASAQPWDLMHPDLPKDDGMPDW